MIKKTFAVKASKRMILNLNKLLTIPLNKQLICNCIKLNVEVSHTMIFNLRRKAEKNLRRRSAHKRDGLRVASLQTLLQ